MLKIITFLYNYIIRGEICLTIFWTKERDDFLIRSYGKYPTNEIAEELGTTINAVKGRASRLKIKLNPKYDKNGNIRCACCQQYLPKEAYRKNSSKSTGVNSYCKICSSKKNADKKKASIVGDQINIRIEQEKITSEITRTCNVCNVTKLGKDFIFYFDENFQKGYRSNICRECKNKELKNAEYDRILNNKRW